MVIARKLARVGEETTGGQINNTTTSSPSRHEGTAVQFAKCCRPIPGDPIIGVLKSGQG